MILDWTFLLLLIFVGGYLMLKMKFLPIRHMGKALRAVFARKDKSDGVTVFSSLCTTLAATIGTGNIVGVAAAVTTGGPGALFWMEAASLISMSTKFAENFLAVRYRRLDRHGQYLGGPFCYMERGLGEKARWLGRLFALTCLLGGVMGMGTIIQSGSIADAVQNMLPPGQKILVGRLSVSLSTVISAAVVTLLAGLVIFGGVTRIASVSERIVPAMALGYILFSVIILVRYRTIMPSALCHVFQCAFTPKAAGGAAAGLTMQQVVLLGAQRGIFSNEAGLGTSPIAAASAKDGDAVTQGYGGMVSVFIDTIVLCTLTGLTVIVTGAAGETGVEIANASWEAGLPWHPDISRMILGCFLIIFGFTSILGWNFNVERCLTYLFDDPKITRLYQCLYLAAVFVGPFLSADFAWRIADITNALMAIPNLIAVFLLRKEVLEHLPK